MFCRSMASTQLERTTSEPNWIPHVGQYLDSRGLRNAAKLIKTIKDEFQMTIDIEKLIEEIDEDGSGEIEFDEFKALLAAQ